MVTHTVRKIGKAANKDDEAVNIEAVNVPEHSAHRARYKQMTNMMMMMMEGTTTRKWGMENRETFATLPPL
jgi:hypothetical protein